jgi:cellulose synthase/poly-beta-1,6-N-acetylglucosamine synthase-like glycosyltransferase
VNETSTGSTTGRDSVAVVVVTFNRADLLEPMLEGLTRLDPAPDQVIVVDNASTDRTPEVLRGAGVQVVSSPENLGGAGGFRLGVKAAYEQGCRACAIGLMHAYQFPGHEQQVAEIARKVGFTHVSASHEVAPLVKLVPRAETTAPRRGSRRRACGGSPSRCCVPSSG